MANPPIVLGQTGKILKNERVDVWLDGDNGDDANDGFSLAAAKKTDIGLVGLIDGVKFGAECRRLVINLRGTNVLSGPNPNTAQIEIETSDVESGEKPLVIVDGGTDLDELLAPVVCTGTMGGLDEIIAGLNDARTQYLAHIGRGIGVGHPGGADVVNVVTAPVATDFDSAKALVRDLLTQYPAHIAAVPTHGSADVTNVLTATDPPFDLKSMTEAYNDIKAMENAHVVDVTGAPAIHDAVGADLITAPNATKASAILGTTLTLAAAGWTPQQWRGYWCEFADGPLAGETYLIRDNDATTLLFNGEWALNPVVGTTFRIVRPATVIDGGFGASFLQFGITMKGVGELWLQNFRTTNGAVIQNTLDMADAKGAQLWSHVILEGQPFSIFPILQTAESAPIYWIPDRRDTSLPLCPQAATDRIGVSMNAEPLVTTPFQGCTLIVEDSVILMFEFLGGVLEAFDSAFSGSSGSAVNHSYGGYGPHAGFARCRFGDSLVPLVGRAALHVKNSYVQLTGGIFENGAHGVEADYTSNVVLLGGMGDNQISGVFCSKKSVCDLYRSYGSVGLPEITGAVGTVELCEDGASEVSKWSAIDGLPVSTPECSAAAYINNLEPPWTDL